MVSDRMEYVVIYTSCPLRVDKFSQSRTGDLRNSKLFQRRIHLRASVELRSK